MGSTGFWGIILSTTRILKKNPFIKKKSFQNGFTPFSSFIFLIEAVFFVDIRCQSMTIDQYFTTAPILNVSKYTIALLLGAAKAYIYTIRVDSKSLNSNHPKVMPCNIDIVCSAFNILLTIAKLPSPCFLKYATCCLSV